MSVLSFALLVRKGIKIADTLQYFENALNFRIKELNEKNFIAYEPDNKYFVDVTSHKFHYVSLESSNVNDELFLIKNVKDLIKSHAPNQVIGLKCYMPKDDNFYNKLNNEENLILV